MSMKPWEEKAAVKRAETLAKIPKEWRLSSDDLERAEQQRDLTGPFIQSFLSEDEVEVIKLDSVPLVGSISDGRLSAVRVAKAFCHATAVAQQINNCLHEIFFDQAIARAEYLDDYYQRNKRTVGPLHGLPVSLKDQFHVKGVDTTQGYVGWIGSNLGIKDPSEAHNIESQIVTELLAAGAVLYCKTALPQSLLFGETKNNIIGETLNPKNRNLSCGGSSGGEGALLALRGSTLGIGTDIGGSVRIPASFNGVYSLKPTPERLSYRHAANTTPGQNTYRSTAGFMSTTLDGVQLGMRSVLAQRPWLNDPAVIPMVWRQDIHDQVFAQVDQRGRPVNAALKFGILWNDTMCQPHPPIQRGLRLVVDALRQSGHKIVNWHPPPHSEAERIHMSFLLSDGGQHVHEQLELSGEPLLPELTYLKRKPPMKLLEYQDMTLQGLDYEAKYAAYWNSTADDDGQIVDAVIMPVTPHAASIPGKTYHTAYTEVVNCLNASAVAFPVTEADQTIDVADPTYEPISDKDRLNWAAYDAEIYHGAPVGLQVMGRKFEEEKILAIARIIRACLESAAPGSNQGRQ
ncbi:Acetamidase-like protein 2 [Elsinoe fawcettii]|nr:Acetamidase-like protein 2 [Elsinoe fawcettii]